MVEKPQLYHLWFSKHHANWCGCGKNMVRWKFWDSDLCPCCLRVPEVSPQHVFFCEMPEMVSFRNELISDIVAWMVSVDTHPHLYSLIVSAFLGQLHQVRRHLYTWWEPVLNAFLKIPQLLILQGFLPKGLDIIQQDYYTEKGSRRTGASWVKKLCNKLINATHSLWTKRNSFEHDKQQHGLLEIEDLRLDTAIRRQFALGSDSLHSSDKYLFDRSRLDLWAQNGAYIRAWLSTVLIARGEYEQAKKEMQNDRGNLTYCRRRATGREINLQIR